MYERAKKHFRKADPRLYKAALDIHVEEIAPSQDLFRDIVWTIVGQQLSACAADTIFARLETLMCGKKMTPQTIFKLSDARMRECGLSGAKMRAIREFAVAVETRKLDLVALPALSDPDVVLALTRVKGIGPWTAEMVLMFSLGRPDIFSRGDLGLRKGMMELYQFKKPPSEKRLNAMIAAWSPYRTYAARVLWKLSDRKTKRVGRKRGA